jgi:hypothetical protein
LVSLSWQYLRVEDGGGDSGGNHMVSAEIEFTSYVPQRLKT